MEEGVKRIREMALSEGLDPSLLTLKMEQGVMSREIQQPLEARIDQEIDSPLEPPEKIAALLTLDFLAQPHFGLLTSRTELQ